MWNKWEGSQFSASFFSIPFHFKVSSLPFHSGVSSDLNVLRFGSLISFFFLSFHSTCHLWGSIYHILTWEAMRCCLRKIAVDDQIAVQVAFACVNTWEYFTSTKLDEESGQLVNPDVGVWDILRTMWATPSQFKSLTNFTLGEFENLMQLVMLAIISHARSTRESHCTFGQPSKLAQKNRWLVSFCSWNMIMWLSMMLSCEIRAQTQ
jgi:hypothetical protein